MKKWIVLRLVHRAIWFRLLRRRYRKFSSHYASNLSLEGPSMGYIINQSTCPNFSIGRKKMSGVGCEIAATYNALKLCGCMVTCSGIIRDFERDRYLMGALRVGDFGSDPYAIGNYLDDNAIHYTQFVSFRTMESVVDSGRGTSQVYIVSFWNRDSMIGGLHTVAFCTTDSDQLIHVYNLYANSTGIHTKGEFSSFIGQNRFIVGYHIPNSQFLNPVGG